MAASPLYSTKDAQFWLVTASVLTGLVAGILFLTSRWFNNLLFSVVRGILPDVTHEKLDRLEEHLDKFRSCLHGDRNVLLKVSAISVGLWFLDLIQVVRLGIGSLGPVLDQSVPCCTRHPCRAYTFHLRRDWHP